MSASKSPSSTTNTSNANPIFDLLMSPLHQSTLVIFGRLGLFEYILSQGTAGASAQDIATQAKWSIRATSAMLISLETSDVLCLSNTGTAEERRYKLTPNAEQLLNPSIPGNIISFLELFWNCTPQQLLEKASADREKENFMLETGDGGAPSKLFIDAMQGQSSHAAIVLAPLLDAQQYLSELTHFVDVGGGSGTLCLEICKHSPKLMGSIYELQGVCPMAESYIQNEQMTDRVKTVAGNMFEDEFYPAADCYGFGNVLHDWSDDANYTLLSKAFASLPKTGGKVVIMEMLLAEDTDGAPSGKAAAGLNILMAVNEDGRQYKASELESMLKKVGFQEVDVVSSLLTPYSAVVATKAGSSE